MNENDNGLSAYYHNELTSFSVVFSSAQHITSSLPTFFMYEYLIKFIDFFRARFMKKKSSKEFMNIFIFVEFNAFPILHMPQIFLLFLCCLLLKISSSLYLNDSLKLNTSALKICISICIQPDIMKYLHL